MRLNGFPAVQARLTLPSRASNLRNGKKMPENSPDARHGGGDVKMGSEIRLERFQAQPKWEIPVRLARRDASRSVTPDVAGQTADVQTAFLIVH